MFCPFDPKKDGMKFFVGNMMAGGAAGTTSLIFVYPLDFARTRLANDVGTPTQSREFKGLYDCLSATYSKDGIRGLYRGMLISIFGVVAYRASYFGLFDTGRSLLP